MSPNYREPSSTLARHPRDAGAMVVMGVSGSGKSTVGRALAERLGWEFQEGDALHSPQNVAKMSAGKALDDDDRAPWLAAIAARRDSWRDRGTPGIISCSALKRRYRDQIIGGRPWVRLIYLEGSRALIAEHIAARPGHFMPAGLLDSQFTALEPPGPDGDAITVAIDRPVPEIAENIVTALSSHRATLMTPA